MFIDNPKNQHYSHIIIGSGPAGISLALGLEKKITGRILIIESGGLERNPKNQQLSDVNATGDLSDKYYSVHAQRVFGGTSTIWNGWCAVLEERSFLNNEWPIAYNEIYPYYEPAAKILEVPDDVYKKPFTSLNPRGSLIYKPFFLSPSKFKTPPVRFNIKYHDYLEKSQRIDVLLNTTCQKIDIKNDKIIGLTLKNSINNSPSYFIPASSITLACGGIGNPKILQSSLPINNTSPVGNYYMGHPHIYNIGKIRLNKELLDEVLSPHVVVNAIQLSDTFCLQNNLLSMSLSFNIKSEYESFITGKQKDIYEASLAIRSEMQPIFSNNIYNTNEKTNTLIQPKQSVSFYFKHQEQCKKSWGFIAKELLASEFGRLSKYSNNFDTVSGGGHHIGTTRMGKDLKTSVINGNCEVHGVKNLFIAGSSIFPASAASNPTLSIVAFSLRLAEYLSKRL